VYSPVTGDLLLRLDGHEGGVWTLAVSPSSPSTPGAADSLVSGSTDHTASARMYLAAIRRLHGAGDCEAYVG
jgi:WD40 repeat protein